MVFKFYPKSLGVFIYTRRELSKKFKTRLTSKGSLALHDKETDAFVCFADPYYAEKGQRIA